MDGGKTGRGDKWREAAGRKMGTTDRRANEEEEIESCGMRSERKDSIMCMSGCIMASCHHAKANQHSRSLRLSFYVQRADD